jgi:hypothetical protein
MTDNHVKRKQTPGARTHHGMIIIRFFYSKLAASLGVIMCPKKYIFHLFFYFKYSQIYIISSEVAMLEIL